MRGVHCAVGPQGGAEVASTPNLRMSMLHPMHPGLAWSAAGRKAGRGAQGRWNALHHVGSRTERKGEEKAKSRAIKLYEAGGGRGDSATLDRQGETLHKPVLVLQGAPRAFEVVCRGVAGRAGCGVRLAACSTASQAKDRHAQTRSGTPCHAPPRPGHASGTPRHAPARHRTAGRTGRGGETGAA